MINPSLQYAYYESIVYETLAELRKEMQALGIDNVSDYLALLRLELETIVKAASDKEASRKLAKLS